MFPFEHPIACLGFLLVRITRTSNKRQKSSKWKSGFTFTQLNSVKLKLCWKLIDKQILFFPKRFQIFGFKLTFLEMKMTKLFRNYRQWLKFYERILFRSMFQNNDIFYSFGIRTLLAFKNLIFSCYKLNRS